MISKADQLVCVVRFEEEAGVPNADDLGALDVLFPAPTCTEPDQERGPIGFAAVFSPTAPSGLQAIDLAVGGTLQTRDLSVQAVMRWDFDAQHTYGAPGTILARGLGTIGNEYVAYGLELHVVDYANRIGEIRWIWQTTGGVLKTETGGAFVAPANDQYVMLTATRRWVSPSEVVIRYYANDQLIVEVDSADGDIGGAVDGHTTVGTRYTGAAYGAFLAGAIDEYALSNYEICLEEIQATWVRLGLLQYDGYRQMLDLMPPGMPISDDPMSRVQGDLMSMGVALGFADGQIENFRNNTMPDRAYGNVLRRWEAITQQPPNQGDALDTRRARVAGHLSSRAGCSVPAVTAALAPVLDCEPTDLQVLAFDNTIRDAFTTLAPERWETQNPDGAGLNTDVTGAALRLRAYAASGAIYGWDPYSPSGGVSALLCAESPRGLGAPFTGGKIFAAMNPLVLPAKAAGGVGADAGLVLWSWSSNSMLFLGLRNNNGTYEVGYQRYESGVATDATWQVIATTALELHYLRIVALNAGIHANTQTFELSYSTTDSQESSFVKTDVEWLRAYQWAGTYLRSPNALAADADVRFAGSSFAFRNTKGTRPYYWYVYRDPALGGAPDIIGANRIVQRMRHAYTFARVIVSKSLVCDAFSQCDNGPCGAL